MDIFIGFLIGLIMAIPLGPMGLLCINKTILFGKRSGLVSGGAIALADFLYALIAVFFYSAVSNFIHINKMNIVFLSSLILIILGISLMRSKNIKNTRQDLSKDFLSVFLFTLSNPFTIISFAAMAATIDFHAKSLIAIGVFLGSMSWWIILVYLVSRLKKFFSPKWITIINTSTGIFIISFALISFLVSLRIYY